MASSQKTSFRISKIHIIILVCSFLASLGLVMVKNRGLITAYNTPDSAKAANYQYVIPFTSYGTVIGQPVTGQFYLTNKFNGTTEVSYSVPQNSVGLFQPSLGLFSGPCPGGDPFLTPHYFATTGSYTMVVPFDIETLNTDIHQGRKSIRIRSESGSRSDRIVACSQFGQNLAQPLTWNVTLESVCPVTFKRVYAPDKIQSSASQNDSSATRPETNPEFTDNHDGTYNIVFTDTNQFYYNYLETHPQSGLDSGIKYRATSGTSPNMHLNVYTGGPGTTSRDGNLYWSHLDNVPPGNYSVQVIVPPNTPACQSASPSPSPSVSPSPSPSPSNHPPTGTFESIDNTTGIAKGWARDPDTTSSIIVQFFLDGIPNSLFPNRYIGSATANLLRTDLPYTDQNHGFQFQIPTKYQDNLVHKLYAYAIDNVQINNPLLTGSPITFTWHLPSPTPSPSPSRTPSPTPTASPTPTPNPIGYGCSNQDFYKVNLNMKDANGLPLYSYTKDCMTVPREMYQKENRFTFFITPRDVTSIPFIKTDNVGMKEDRNLNWSVSVTHPSIVYVFYRKIPGQVAPSWLQTGFTKLTNDDFSNLNQFLLRKNELGLIGVYDIYQKAPLVTFDNNGVAHGGVELGPASDNLATAYSMYLVAVKPVQ